MAYLSKFTEGYALIYSNIKKLMEDKGISFRDLEAISGVTQRTINKARQDGRPNIESCTLSKLSQIASALGVQVKDLFEEK